MASIRKKNGKYQVRVSWYDDQNKRRFKTKTFVKKSEATSYANELEVLKSKDFISADSSMPFTEYFWNWFETYKEPSVSDRTKLTYKQAYNALNSHLGKTAIENIDRRKYQMFITNYGKHHAKSTVSKYNSLIHACVKDAIYDGVISKDFVQNTSLVFNKKKTRIIDYLSIDEMNHLVDHILKTKNANFTSKYMVLLAIYTGARLGELQALTWKDINFNFRTISITKSWHEGLQEFKDTKNESSKRVIRVNESVLNVLKELKVKNKNMIFKNQYNTIPTSSAVNKTLRECLKACEIDKPSLHFHSLRHTHVAFLLSKGIDLYIISKRLGHSDISTTSRVYSYLIDEYRMKSDNKIESILSTIGTPSAPKVHQTFESIRKIT
ncbi:MAG: tyrosine-type recombinase/integrase [Liquorilactobacillus ghanensis]|uniref:tyrosine-type recombinase/integrase n=2 Tax=Liquorilactobacillus ghanensis TaxID=399370 RepID=UPI0039EBCEF5